MIQRKSLIIVFFILGLLSLLLFSHFSSSGNFTGTESVTVNDKIKNPSFEILNGNDNSNNWVVAISDPGLSKIPSTDWKTDGIRSLEIKGIHSKNPTNTNLGVDIYQLFTYNGNGNTLVADLNIKSPIKDGNIYLYLCWSYSVVDAQIDMRRLPDLQRCRINILSTSSSRIIESGYRQMSVSIPTEFKGRILKIQLSSVSWPTDTDNSWDYNWDNVRIV